MPIDSRIPLMYEGIQLPNQLENALSAQRIQNAQMENQVMQNALAEQSSPEYKQSKKRKSITDEVALSIEDLEKHKDLINDEASLADYRDYFTTNFPNSPARQSLRDMDTFTKAREQSRLAKLKPVDPEIDLLNKERIRQQIQDMKDKKRNLQIVKTDQGIGYIDENNNFTPLTDNGIPIKPPASPAAEKPPTQDQANAATFGARAEVADQIIEGLKGDYSPMGVGAGKTFGGAVNWALSENTQKAGQAQRDFINAVLRKESGATIADTEFDNAKQQYFPQPGDTDAVILQKAQNRKIAIQGLKNSAGNAAFSPNIDPNVMGDKNYSGLVNSGDIMQKLDATERGFASWAQSNPNAPESQAFWSKVNKKYGAR